MLIQPANTPSNRTTHFCEKGQLSTKAQCPLVILEKIGVAGPSSTRDFPVETAPHKCQANSQPDDGIIDLPPLNPKAWNPMPKSW